MNKRRVVITRIVLEMLVQCLLFFSILVTVYFGIIKVPLSHIYKLFYVIPVTIAAYFARRVIKSVGLFIAVHGLFLVGAVFVGGSDNESFVITLVTLVICLVSFAFRKRRDETGREKIPIAIVAIFLAECYTGYASNNSMVMEFAVWFAVAYVIVYMLYMNALRLEELCFMNSGTANFPRKRIYGTNIVIMTFASVAVFIGMAAFYSGPMGNIFVIMKNAFLRFLGWLLSLLLKDDGSDSSQIATELMIPESTTEDSTERQIQDPPGALKDFLNALLILIAIVIIIVAVIFIIKAVRKALAYVGNMRSTEADIIEAVDDDTAETVETVRKSRNNDISDTDLNLKVRKLYRKRVKSVKKVKGEPADTALPKDITQMFAEGEAADTVTEIYEKARYSNETVTKEEVEAVKNVTAKK